MADSITSQLESVRRRQRLRSLCHGAVGGLACGALAAVAAEGLHRIVGGPNLSVALLVIGSAFGAVRRAAMDHPASRAAAAVDAHYNLKDRVTSALAFAEKQNDDPFAALAIADAQHHLLDIDARQVVPIGKLPHIKPALAAVALALVVMLLPQTHPASAAPPAPPVAGIIAEANTIAEQMRQLAEQARLQEDEKVEKLADSLAEQAEALKEPGVDVREALAELSQMQAALAEQRARYNTAVTDAHLSKLGEAMSQSEAWSDAGAALEAGNFDDAAEATEQLEPSNNPRQDEVAARAMSNEAHAMQRSGLSAMSVATMRFTQSVRSSDRKGASAAARQMASQMRAHVRRKNMSELLRQQMSQLNESKGKCAACQGGGENSQNSSKNGGKSSARSDKASHNWSLGDSGNPTDNPTSLDATREGVAISGDLGEGSVDVETMRSPEARQRAGRAYKDKFDDYQRMAESVLETEPIPMGHRQVIRRYFEAIRPGSDE